MWVRRFVVLSLVQLAWTPMTWAGRVVYLGGKPERQAVAEYNRHRAVQLLNSRAAKYKNKKKPQVLCTNSNGDSLVFTAKEETAQILRNHLAPISVLLPPISVDDQSLETYFPNIKSKDDVITLIVGLAAQ